ncbi:PLP-dependent aminotransferase family protein [Pseudomonas psychrophila]|uniref:GntR family transcriptional regulator / MocR family aminotransferase n=1 Tax=Pseudomonas psychrophila TaxID=122355 RepID=A0ABY0VV07_9PSED|nr:PLP-dependent aminotransferase family protein [Pseudomonas psychrophila]KAB0489603.1 PLP-dependent aminotransferase family protein [Pseudomonas psychrophila]KMM98909.1 DNA-binding protein [Pseudomonas psychrophila]KOX63227.1 DNA-binding protein [Pseudomonas psychrophila]QIE33143.1 PLP-dependent aminotransferase family protein [Pseudomonas psychrophila]WVI99707.1 PLP-dependent aminotransferase family protein [Pseudomonas psychrophila]
MKTPIPRFSPLDPGSSEPIYRQLYWRFREAIANGVLGPGERVPAARALAKELGLARGTIDAAYSLLTSEGYLQARGQAGTIVTPDIPIQPTAAIRTPDSSPSVRHQPETLPFQMGLPALDAFPKKVWAQIGARCVRSTRAQDMANPSAHGLQSLRTAIATYLQVSRGIACSPAQIFITAGYRDTLSLIAHALLKAGDRVLIEDPGYPPTRQLLEHLHIQTVALPVDHDGLQLPAQGSDALQAQAAVVTPAHQSPLCVSLSLPRRLELLGWASRQQAWIIEDDYDGEYRYVSRPLPALKSLDRDGRVLYSGTFSKVLFPGLRLAYAVVPQEQVERFQQASQTFRSSCPELTQAIVATFMTEGHFARHIQRMRKLYSERRAFTVAGLNKVLGNRVHIDANPGGMHLILRLGNQMTDWELVERMRQDGLFAEALSEWSLLGEKPSGLLLGFANITSQASAEQLGERILALLEPAG